VISRRGLFAGVGGLFLGRGFIMPEQLVPDSMAATIADMQRRLQVLEATPRVGLNRVRNAYATAWAVPSTFDAWEYGTAGNTWIDDQSATGTGYPQITMVTPTLVLVMMGGDFYDLGNAAGFRSARALVSIDIDGVPNWQPMDVYNANVDRHSTPFHTSFVYRLTPGTHTFKMTAWWFDKTPAAGTLPIMENASLIVLPMSST
jgi:hypothetical protein